jgi:hypothetical protein
MKTALSSDFAGTGWSGSGILVPCLGVFSQRPQAKTTFVVEARQPRQDYFFMELARG